MTTTKLTRTLLAGMMTCTMALTTLTVADVAAQPVNAAEVMTQPAFTVDLFKMKLHDGQQITNTGEPIPAMATVEGLKDVTFDYYNITALFYQVKKAQNLTDNKAVMDYISENWTSLKGSVGTPGTSGKTEANGLVTISNLPKKTTVDGNSVHSIYLFDEVPSTANADFMISPPFILGMSDKLAAQSKVTLYAKNYGVTKSLWGTDASGGQIELDDDSKAYSFEVGDDIHYTSTSPIPKNVLDDYTTLRFLDTMSTPGTDFKQLDDVGYTNADGNWQSMKQPFEAAATKKVNSNDTAWETLKEELNKELVNKVGDLHAGFYYEFDMSKPVVKQLMGQLAGQKLEFRYTMVINDKAVAYQDIDNTFYGIFTNKHGESVSESTPPPVETGAHKFKKADSKTNNGLKGAKFVLRRGTTGNYEYAQFDKAGDNGTYQPTDITWTANQNDASPIESGANGQINLHGLAQGGYVLLETKAPDGYTITTPETSFTIKNGAIGNSTIEGKTIKNTPENHPLPITGSTGIAAFVVIGIAAMGTAVVYQKKRQQG